MKSNSSPHDILSKFFKIASCIVSEWLSTFFNNCMTVQANSQISGKLTLSHYFLKFISLFLHVNINQFVFSQHCQRYLKSDRSFLNEHNLIHKRQYTVVSKQITQPNSPLKLFMMKYSKTLTINQLPFLYFWTYRKLLTILIIKFYVTNSSTTV